MTIYEKTPGALIASSERTVATFESGLCRVDQRYTCATDNAATHRSTVIIGSAMPDGDTAPTIDGLYVFPAPQEIKRQDGFTDFVVSAYGRTSSAVQNVRLEQRRAGINRGNCGVWEVTGEICIPKNQQVTLEMLEMDEMLFMPFDFVLDTFSGYKTLKVTEIETRLPSYGSVSTPVSVGGISGSVSTRGQSIRYYTVQMTADGTTVAVEFNMWLSDPKIIITSARPFGEFVEIQFKTERENTSAVIV